MKQELTDKINELEVLVSEIENQRSWKIALSQIEEQIEILNDNWQAVDKDKFYEMQVTKIGLSSVLTLVDQWKDELADLRSQLEAEEHPDIIQQGDYDTELIEKE